MRSILQAEGAAGTEQHQFEGVRTARLLFDAELTSGELAPEATVAEPVLRALRSGQVPTLPVRVAQDLARKLGRLDHEAASAPLLSLRRAVLANAAPPRFLIRVDEFPHYRAWDDPQRFGTHRYEQFHEIMQAANVPYLVAVLPRVSRAPLDPNMQDSRPLDDDERALLGRMRDEGVTFALHGRDHRTRHPSPRRRSELCGLSRSRAAELLDVAISELRASGGGRPDVFVPPYNRFDASQWPLLAARFTVIGGGPESVRYMGFQRPPQWRGESVYLPSYPPYYGRATAVLPAARRAVAEGTGLWTPLVLHWGWEAEDGWQDLKRLLEVISSSAVRWEDFHAAVERSR